MTTLACVSHLLRILQWCVLKVPQSRKKGIRGRRRNRPRVGLNVRKPSQLRSNCKRESNHAKFNRKLLQRCVRLLRQHPVRILQRILDELLMDQLTARTRLRKLGEGNGLGSWKE